MIRKPVQAALLSASTLFLLACGETASTDDIPDAVTADPDHYAVEFENDVVRILRVEYGPGEESVMHRHPPLCSVTLSETDWRMEEPDGSSTETTASHGDVGCDEASTHRPANPGTTPNEVVLFELKEDATPGTVETEGPDAVAVDPDHYSVEFENDLVRVIRIRYEPGDTGVAHGHPANCVVWLASGGEEDAPSVGEVQCFDAEVHTPSGGDSVAVELVAVEMKGRAVVGS